jgi:hypothetical protein
VFLYRRNRPLAIALGVAVLARFLFFARWFTPGGGVAWGPRLLFPVTALLAIAAGATLEQIWHWPSPRHRGIAWLAVASLAAASAGVSVLSVAVGYEKYWQQWTAVSTSAGPARSHAYYWSLAHNAIAGNVHLLRTGVALAPIHFRHGPDGVGVFAIAIAVVAIVTALVAARNDVGESRSLFGHSDDGRSERSGKSALWNASTRDGVSQA